MKTKSCYVCKGEIKDEGKTVRVYHRGSKKSIRVPVCSTCFRKN